MNVLKYYDYSYTYTDIVVIAFDGLVWIWLIYLETHADFSLSNLVNKVASKTQI